MKIEQIMARAEKELSTATRNLETAQRRGAPGQDVRNLEAKVEYRKAVLDMLNGGHLELFDKVEQLEKENAELLARAEQDEARSGKAERERNEAVRICAKLIALCSPPKEWVPKLFQRKINRPGDYMGCGYTFLDGFNLIIENFVETADDELYTVIRDATEKEIIERSMRMSGTKEE